MLFWSKGLGKRSHLNIACGTEQPKREGEFMLLYGMTRPPIVWNYTITMTERDFLSILDIGLSKKFLSFLMTPKRFFYALKLLYLVLKMSIKFILIR
jgi:hypothetical protein